MVDTRDDSEGEYRTAYERLHDERPESELALDNDESLPWLESSDYAEGQGGDTSRIIGFALLAVVVLLAILGAIWYFTRPAADPELAGDGSAIQAPAGDYKQRPDNAGGTQYANTGDVAPAVGQGKTREGRIAQTEAAPKPSASAAPTASASAADADGGKASGGVGVQVGAYSTRANAERGWQELNRQTDKLSGVNHRVVEGTVDNGTVYRLQAVAGSRDGGNALCQSLKADGLACQVK